ncbi:MAG: cytochrome P450 [Myxococcales bacterium]|nr:cytochrome P450 [Myxococcales bacterium]
MTGLTEMAGRIGRVVGPTKVLDEHPELPDGPSDPAWLQTWLWLTRPTRVLRRYHRRYGETFTMRVAGVPPFVMYGGPEAVKEIFTGPPDELYAGEANIVLEPILGQNSVLLLDGARHMRQRRLLLPPFHGQRMRAYGEVMRDVTLESMKGWPRGRPFPVHERTQAITMDVILRTVFGLDANDPAMGEFHTSLAQLLDGTANPLMLIPAAQTDLGPWSPGGRLRRRLDEVDRLVYGQIRRRRREGTAGREDVLSMLIDARDEDGAPMTEAELRDELMTLLLAGHETTATSLAWTFYRLLKNPDALAKAHQEIDAVFPDHAPIDPDRVSELRFIDACGKETLRMNPVVPAVARRLQSPMTIGGWDLPAGVVAVPNIYLVHHDPRVWPDPLRFDPSRFLDSKPSPYTFFPFGGGIRRCIGMAFALYEMQVVLATVLSRLTIEPAPDAHVRLVRRAITFAPSDGMPLIVKDRWLR